MIDHRQFGGLRVRAARRDSRRSAGGAAAAGITPFLFGPSPRTGTSFRRSSTREVVDALLCIRRRGGISRAGAGRRPGRTEANPGEVEPGCDDGEEQEFLHLVSSSAEGKVVASASLSRPTASLHVC